MLKAILFDLGWTLADLPGCMEFEQELEAALGSERYNIVKDRFIQAHREVVAEDEWVRRVAEEIDASPEEIPKLHLKVRWPRYELYPDTISTLKAIKEKGLKLGLVSNSTIGTQAALNELGHAPRFDSVIMSCEVGVMKPDPKIFQMALAELDCEPGEAVMVGDNPKFDVAGAENVGIRGILLDRNDKHATDAHEKIRSLEELLRVL